LSGAPVPPFELLPAARDRAFVSLGAGGALAVGGCQERDLPADCLPCGESATGCVSRAVWWIDPAAAVHELAPLPRELMHPRPLVVSAEDGAPWLLAGRVLGRFDPWQARFNVSDAALAPSVAPLQAVNATPGLFVWARQNAGELELGGLRHSQRGAFSQDVAPLLVGNAERLIPHLLPSAVAPANTLLRYSVSSGLELQGPQAAVSIASTTYAALTLELTLAEGPAPLVRLAAPGAADDSEVFGTLDCPWPEFQPPTPGVAGSEVRLFLERRGERVRLRSSGSGEASEPCARALPERIHVQISGTPLGTTRLTRIELRRSVEL
jgi:hypothetical protein